MKRNLFTLMMAILVAITTVAQTFTGRVVDEKQTPIPFANVALLNASDSAFVTGTTTNRDGDFTLTGNATKPIIKISYLGYKTQVLDSLSGHLGIIVLEPEATMLGEVVVKGVRPTYKLTTEGIKTDVDGTLLSKVGTATEVLGNLPGVHKKGTSVEVFGKGTPLIYINGRQMRNDSELAQISSENIQSVELITNPGAKYDATVEAVILIKTKRPQGEGFSFNTQASYYAAERPDLDLGTNWNFRHKGLDVFGSVWYNDGRSKQDDDVILDVKADTLWHIDELMDIKSHYNSLYTSIGTNYIFNDNHSAGFRYYTKAHFLDRTSGTPRR